MSGTTRNLIFLIFAAKVQKKTQSNKKKKIYFIFLFYNSPSCINDDT